MAAGAGGTGRSLLEILKQLGKSDADIIRRAAELAGESGTFVDDLTALAKAVVEIVGQHGKVYPIGTLGGQTVYGSARTGIGIVGIANGTAVVRVTSGGVEILGYFR
jgi:hypothetical protein